MTAYHCYRSHSKPHPFSRFFPCSSLPKSPFPRPGAIHHYLPLTPGCLPFIATWWNHLHLSWWIHFAAILQLTSYWSADWTLSSVALYACFIYGFVSKSYPGNWICSSWVRSESIWYKCIIVYMRLNKYTHHDYPAITFVKSSLISSSYSAILLF